MLGTVLLPPTRKHEAHLYLPASVFFAHAHRRLLRRIRPHPQPSVAGEELESVDLASGWVMASLVAPDMEQANGAGHSLLGSG